ncbi:Glyoxylate/hydroxypyruvate reductase HPR3 [Spatholobus suberectus]|nr:Glyoxylate/hydroxypyruvate reductase HPR3 [Spatholobus suberectus]
MLKSNSIILFLSLPFSIYAHLFRQNVDPASIQAILCNPRQKISADVIRLLPSLGIIVTTSNGTAHIDLAECSHGGIQVVSIPGDQLAEDIADMVVGLLIDVMWKVSATDRHIRKWGPSKPCNLSSGSKLEGKRVGIVGLGKIGGEVAKRLEVFGCRIMYNSRNQKPCLVPFLF